MRNASNSGTYKHKLLTPRFHPRRRFLVVAVVMVLLAYLVRAFLAWTVAISFTNAHPGYYGKLPLLLDATVDELKDGLEKGAFSSVDLVNVSLSPTNGKRQVFESRLFVSKLLRVFQTWANEFLGIYQTYPRSQCYLAHGDRTQP